MQTFLPYPDFARSAEALDQLRLGKQRVEAMQIFNALTVPGHGYRHHPATKMWQGCEEALVRYGLTVCATWTGRGFKDTVADTLGHSARERLGLQKVRSERQLVRAKAMPRWLGDEAFHRAHRATLLRKDPDHYSAVFDDFPTDPEVLWPQA